MVMAIFGCGVERRNYDFNFHVNGGSYVAGFIMNRSDFDETDIPVSTRAGYAFAGWYHDEGLTQPATAASIEENDEYHVALYAKWIPADVDVSVQYWQENLSGDYELFESETIGGLTGTLVTANPKEYRGFEEDPAHPDRVLSGTPQAGVPLVLRLYYARQSFSLTFIPGNGTEPFGRSYLFGESIEYPSNVTREYFDFVCWYADPDYLSDPFVATTMPAWGTVLYAKWTPTLVTLTYVTNGGTPIPPFVAGALTQSYGTRDTEKAGYLLEGWYDDALFTQRHNFSIMPGTDLTVYAKWVHEDSAITVEHYFESTEQAGTYSLFRIVHVIGEIGVLYRATLLNFPGYVINPTHPDQIAEGTPSIGHQTVLKLYYHSLTYHLFFEENGGSDVEDTYAKYLSPLTDLPQSAKSGFSLTWCVDEDLIHGVDWIQNVMPSQDLTLYAKWTRIQVTLAFVTNGGIALESHHAETASVFALPIPIYAGHAFAGWYVDAELANPYVDLGVMPDADLTLYAKWTRIQVTLAFVTNGGIALDSHQAESASVFALPIPVYAGYAFAGWFVDAELTTPYNDLGVMPDTDLTLYAKWTPNLYTLYFDEDGGSVIEDLSLPWGSAITEPADPVRPGWIFGGWTTDVGHATAYQFTTMPSHDVTVYAYWMPKYVVIYFETNGGSDVDNASGRALSPWTMPADPSYADHTFAGWYLDALFTEPYVDDGMFPLDNQTLYAKWYGALYWITFDMMGGDYIPGIQVAVGDTIHLPEPTREGFIFAGWFNAMLTEPFTQTIMTAETIRLYAKWTLVD